jgi:hypothetical protein
VLWNQGLQSSFADTMSTEVLHIFRSKNIKLIHEIRSDPGYFLHTGQNKGRAGIFKIFNPGPTAQQVNEPLGQRGSAVFTTG